MGEMGQMVTGPTENVLLGSVKIGSWVKNTPGLTGRRRHLERAETGV